MRFVNVEGIKKDVPTSELRVGGAVLNLHSEWSFLGYCYELPTRVMVLRWQDTVRPEWLCEFRFTDVNSVRVEARDPAYPWDHAQGLFMMIYQELEGEVPFVKFWFDDQSTIEIAADTLTLTCHSSEGLEVPAPGIN